MRGGSQIFYGETRQDKRFILGFKEHWLNCNPSLGKRLLFSLEISQSLIKDLDPPRPPGAHAIIVLVPFSDEHLSNIV